MRSLEEHLSTYAQYHRDRRNIATHFVGIPMIVFGIAAFLARPAFVLGVGVPISPALLVALGTVVFYFLLDGRFGVAMLAFMGAAWWCGAWVAAQPLATWAIASAILFVGGWIIQFIGHAFEGKKPAFVDDLVGLVIGPLFIVAEAAFALGLRRELHDEIVRNAGPTRARLAASQ